MDSRYEKREFLRGKSPLGGIIGSGFLAFLLFCLLLGCFVARSAISLFRENTLKSAVQEVFDDASFRSEIAKTIHDMVPANTITRKQITDVMKDETVTEAIGQLGSELVDRIVNSNDDPYEIVLKVLEDSEEEKLFRKALKKGMSELNVSSEQLLNQANKLAEKYNFAPPKAGSSDMEVVLTILEGSREKVETESKELFKTLEEGQETINDFSFLFTLFGTFGFIAINLLLAGAFYGLFLLLTRSWWKPLLFLGIPYAATGLVLLCVKLINFASLFSIKQNFRAAIDVAVNAAVRNGITALIVGCWFIIAFVVLTIIFKFTHKEESEAWSVPTAKNS